MIDTRAAAAVGSNQTMLLVYLRVVRRVHGVFLRKIYQFHLTTNDPTTVSVTIQTRAVAAGYVPDGMTPEQYRKLVEKEKAAMKEKKLGAFGPQSFKSRSLLAFQTDLEKGKAGHLMPVLNAQEKLKAGKIKKEDIPYMQRLGSWDGSDIGKKTTKGNEKDKMYNANARPGGMDWLGRNPPSGPNKANQAKK